MTVPTKTTGAKDHEAAETETSIPAKNAKIMQRSDWLSFWIVFLITLGVYTYTLNPTVSLEDSGELAVAADYLGVPHPPGYPIWTLVGWFFQWIFDFVEYNGHPNPAWGVALSSAFFGALACGLIGMLISCSGRHLVGSLKTDRFSMKHEFAPLMAGAVTGFIICALLAYARFGGSSVILGMLIFLAVVYVFSSFVAHYFYGSNRIPFLLPLEQLGPAIYGLIVGIILFCGAWVGNGLAIMVIMTLIVLTVIASTVHFHAAKRTPELPADVLSILTLASGIAGGLLLAFSSVMWSQSNIVEVYSLNVFFMACIVLCTYIWMCKPDRVHLLYLTAFLFGLGLTNHQSLAFLMPFLLVAIAYRDRELFATSLAIIFAGIAILGIFKASQYSAAAAEALAGTAANKAEVAAEAKASVQFFSKLAFFFTIMPAAYFMSRKQFIHLTTLGGIFLGMLLIGFGLTGGEEMASTMKIILAGLGGIFFLAPCMFMRSNGKQFRPWLRDYMIAISIFAGLMFHAYMAVASEQNPPMNWGYPRTPQGFKHALTRGQYEKISLKSNWDQITAQLSLEFTPPKGNETKEQLEKKEKIYKETKFHFFRQLAVYFYNPRNEYPVDKYSMVNMYTVPMSLVGLVPFVLLFRVGRKPRTWFICTAWAFFFLTVMFLIAQYPALDIQDLFIKRVQYIQAHGVYAMWISYGLLLLSVLAYKLIPKKVVALVAGLAIVTIAPAIGLHKEFKDEMHINTLGASSMNGHDFGWQFGYYQLKGANGLILDHLEETGVYEYRIDDYAISFLRERMSGRLYADRAKEVEAIIAQVANAKAETNIDPEAFEKDILKGLKGKERNYVIQSARLAAYKHHRSQPGYVASQDEVPDMNYPPPMEQDAVFFGGTDPGRFVPTYMIYSAKVRPDVYLITQNALADGTYMNVMRDLYGNDMWIPSARDSNTAFSRYIAKVRAGQIKAGADLNFEDGKVSVQGVGGVMAINAILCKDIHEHNNHSNSFYVEESYPIAWMFDYLTPHGLIMKINAAPTPLTQKMIDDDFKFWTWYSKRLLNDEKFMTDVIARKTFSKLRSSIAGMYAAKGHDTQAELAYQQSLELYPLSPEATFKLADFYIKRQRIEDAEGAVARLMESDIENAKIEQFQTSISQLKTLNTKRLELEGQLVKGGRQDISVAFRLLGVYGSMGMNKQVDALARSIMANPSSNPVIKDQLGQGMARLKRYALAKEIYGEILKANPKSYKTHVNLAALALQQNKHGETLQSLKQAVATGQNNARQEIAKDPRFKGIQNTVDFVKLIYPNALKQPKQPAPRPGIGPSSQPPRGPLPRSVLPPGQK